VRAFALRQLDSHCSAFFETRLVPGHFLAAAIDVKRWHNENLALAASESESVHKRSARAQRRDEIGID
jgi:hypothetical protein